MKKERKAPHAISQDKEKLLEEGVLFFKRPIAEAKATQLQMYFGFIVEIVNDHEIRFNKNQLTIFDGGA